MKTRFRSERGYTSIEVLVFLLLFTAIVAFQINPTQKAWKALKVARTQAAEEEINYRKQRYLFESTPEKIRTFNTLGDEARWELLAENLKRDNRVQTDPNAFIRFSGMSKIFIGKDSETARLNP